MLPCQSTYRDFYHCLSGFDICLPSQAGSLMRVKNLPALVIIKSPAPGTAMHIVGIAPRVVR